MARGMELGALVEQYRAGESGALETLMWECRPSIVAAARRCLRSSPDIEDTVQETWLAFVTHADTIKNPDGLTSWLWVTATNIARRIAVKSHRCITVDTPNTDAAQAPSPSECEQAVLASERSAAVRRAMQALTAKDRRLLVLLTDERELPYHVVSTMVNRPVGSLGPTRQRLLVKLRRHPALEHLLADEPIPA
jgi:RNA polymerase sigma factor (sigma-70 family)